MQQRSDIFNTICKVYEDLYRQVSLNTDFVLHLKNNDEIMLNNFIDTVDFRKKSLDFKFICDFIEFQFSYWHDKETKFGKGRVMLSWVFGRKAIERWQNTDSKQKEWLKRIHLKTNITNISTYSKLNKSEVIKPFFIELNQEEEEQKKRFFNTEQGLFHCINNTTLYNHKSKNCALCIHITQCKQILFLNFKNIAKIRGYKNG